MCKYFLAGLIYCFVCLGHSQINTLYFDTYKDVSMAESLCRDENYKEALTYVKKVKKRVKMSKDPKSFNAFGVLVSIGLVESDIYTCEKDYDRAILLIQDLREDLRKRFNLSMDNVFSNYNFLTIKQGSILNKKGRFKEALLLLRTHKEFVFTNYNFNYDSVFSAYELIVMNEDLILMEMGDSEGRYQLELDEATRIKTIMTGNEDLTHYYFDQMLASINTLVNNSEIDSENHKNVLKDAVIKVKILIKEFKSNPYKNNSYLSDLTKDYFNFKKASISPFTASYDVNKAQLIKGKADLTLLLVDIKSNKDLTHDDHSDLIESIEDTLNSLDELISNKELQEGRYQKVLNAEAKKEDDSNAKDYSYYLDKFNELNTLMSTTMYYQYTSQLNEFLDEVRNSNFKENDRASYFELLYYIHINFYSAYRQLKDYEKALHHLDEAVISYKMQPKGKIIEDIVSNFNWYYSSIYFQTKNYEKALKYSKRSLIKPTTSTWAQFSFLASIYFELDDFDKALEWQNKYVDYLELNKNDPSYTYSINFARHNLGKYHLALQQYDEAHEKFKLALKGFSESKYDYGYNDYILGTLYADMGILYSKLDIPQLAEDNMLKFGEIFRIPFFESLLNIDENSRLQINDAHEHSPNTLFYYLSQNDLNSDDIRIMGYNYALMSKQLLLNTSETIRTNASMNDIKELREINNKWSDVKNQLKEVKVTNRDSLMDYARVYEKELIMRGKASIIDLFENSKTDWYDLQQHIKSGEAVIEFVSYSPYYYLKEKDNTQYGAFILLKDTQAPIFVHLCDENKISDILQNRTSNNTDPNTTIAEIYESNGTKLYDHIWKPLQTYLDTVTTIYFSPSGQLHNLSFSAFINPANSKTLSETYNLIQLSSTKDLTKVKTVNTFKKAALFGDIAYNMSKNTQEPLKTNSAVRANRGKDFRALPGTKKEIEQIENLLRKNKIECFTYTQDNATEENLMSIVKEQPDIIHIGTHAFYLVPSTNDFDVTDMIGSSNLQQDKNAMNRSGLALAEANYYWKYGNKISTNREDGILTANEISTLNLNNVKLAVISACESGLGASKNNEGVFGIQRGLKMAGTQKLLVSLWKVDDTVTQEYMEDFYTNIFTHNLSIQGAYFKTQKNIKAKYSNPYYWAAFVLIQ